MEEIHVEEGDYVEAGQVIAALGVETLATLRQEIDDARVKIQALEEDVNDLENSYTSLDVVLAEEKIVQARVALRDAEDALEDLFILPDLADDIVRAESDVDKAKLDLAKAEDALVTLTAGPSDPDDVERAVVKIDSIEVSLENAQLDLDLLDKEWDAKLAAARDVEEDALTEYQAKVLRYLGADVSREDSLLPPQDMLSSWGTSLEALFAPPQSDDIDFAEQLRQFQEDPDTPWSEIAIQSWNLFFVGSIIPVCEEGAILAPYQTCISRELETPWQELDETRISLTNLQDQYVAARSKSEEGVGKIEQSLIDAQTDLGELFEGPDPLDVVSARFNIYQAQLTLEEAEDKVADIKEQLLEKPESPRRGSQSQGH